METVSIIGMIAALALLSFLVMKGVNIFIAAIASSLLVAITGGIPLYDALQTNYMGGFTGFFGGNFLIFMAGALMGQVYEKTNAAKAIAKLIINGLGKKAGMIAVPLAIGILTYGGKKSVWMYCHNCRKVTEFVLNSKADRVNTLYTLSGGCQDVKNTLVPVYTASCPECGESTQLNPAVVQDLSVIEDTDSLKGEGRLFLNEETANRDSPHVDEDMTVSDTGINGMRTARMASECRSAEVSNTPVNSTETSSKHTSDSKETAAYRQEDAARQKERRRLYREIRNNQGNLTMSCGNYRFVEGTSIIEPWSFNAGAYGMTPAFVKSRLSIGLLSVMGATFCQMGVAKNKIKTVFDGAGLPISREQLTGGINCFARAFLHKTAEQIKKDILSSSETILMDETTLVVTETARKKKAQGSSRKSEMWVLNSGWTSSISASYYYISPTRAGKSAVEILKDMPKSVKKYLVADGYTGYDTAARTLNKEYGTSIVLARCHTHSRRPLHKFLKEHGLLKIYNQYLLPKNSRFTDFYDNLKKYREKKRGRLLTERDAELLSIRNCGDNV